MELRQLRYFVTVADERHFGRAAERLHMAQPGLSQQIRALERSIGAVLFDRDARPIALTDAGRRLLPHARSIVEAASRAVAVTRGGPKQPGPILKMGVTAIGDYPEFVKLIEVFSVRQADVDVRILPSMPDAIVDSLVRRTLDIGVIHPPLDWPDDAEPPGYVKLGDQEVLLVIPAGHPLAAQERVERAALLNEPVIGVPQDLAPKFTKRLIRDLFGVFPHPRAVDVPEAVDRDARFRLVAEGRGISGISVPAKAELPPDRDGIAFRRVAGRPTLIEYGLAWLGVNASPSTLSLVELARELQGVAVATQCPKTFEFSTIEQDYWTGVGRRSTMEAVAWHVWLQSSVLHLDARDVLADEWETLLDSVNGALRRFEPKEVVIWVEPSVERSARGTMIAALRHTISQDGTPVRIESGATPWPPDQ